MDILAKAVRFDESSMWVELSDGRAISVPLAWFPRLLNATKSQRNAVRIGRSGLHWSEIDEDISIDGILAGRRDQTLNGVIARDADVSGPLGLVKMSKKDEQLFVERRSQGDYAVRRPNSERASDVLPTQAAAIARAKELNPNRDPVVERVRHTSVGKPDQWRRS